MEVGPWDALPAQLSWKEKIAYLGVCMQEAQCTVDLPVEHVLGQGMYIRKMRIPANTIYLGREHIHGHMMFLTEGSAVLILPSGAKKRYDAVASLHTNPGFQAVAYTLTDIEVSTHHPNPDNLTDVEALEASIFKPVAELQALGLSVRQRLDFAA